MTIENDDDPPPAQTYTAEEAEALAEQRVQEDRRARRAPARAPATAADPKGAGPMELLGKMIELQAMKLAGKMAAKPANEQPATGRAGGAPPKPNTLELSNFSSWPEADRKAYLEQKGPVAYRAAVNASLRGKTLSLKR